MINVTIYCDVCSACGESEAHVSPYRIRARLRGRGWLVAVPRLKSQRIIDIVRAAGMGLDGPPVNLCPDCAREKP